MNLFADNIAVSAARAPTLQRLDAARIEEELCKPDVADAVLVAVFRGWLAVYDDFLEIVARVLERKGLLSFFMGLFPCKTTGKSLPQSPL